MLQEVVADFIELGQMVLCKDLWGIRLEGRGLSGYNNEYFC